MDFISRDPLIAAMHAWVLDKARPLEDLLLEASTLDAETHALVVALVARHLKLHGDHPERNPLQ